MHGALPSLTSNCGSSDVQQVWAEGHPVTICQGGLLRDEHVVDIDHVRTVANPFLLPLNLNLALQAFVALLGQVLPSLPPGLHILTLSY